MLWVRLAEAKDKGKNREFPSPEDSDVMVSLIEIETAPSVEDCMSSFCIADVSLMVDR